MKIICRLKARLRRKFKERWIEFYGAHCAYCTIDCSEFPTIDHIIPLCKGGGNRIENLVIACQDCNKKKGDKLPRNFRRLILQPLGK